MFGALQRKMRNGSIKRSINIYCKQCQNLKIQLWRELHIDKVKELNRSLSAKINKENWLANNKNKRKEYEKCYYINNIDQFKRNASTSKCKENKRIYKKNRRHSDPLFKLRDSVSNAIFKALKRGKSNKAGESILQYLNYTIQDLKLHLEKQFDDKMFWNNHGIYWHIDHIIPQSDLPYSSMKNKNFEKCWALNNLRPLNAKQNMSDGSRRTRHKIYEYTNITI